MILLDTNVVSEPLRARPDPGVLQWLDAQPTETVYLSTISLSELLLGIESLPAGRRRRTLASAVEERVADLFGERILPFDVAAAEAYAKVVTAARRAGYPIAIADGQIAAVAAARGLIVATRDDAPFRAAGVTVVNPWL